VRPRRPAVGRAAWALGLGLALVRPPALDAQAAVAARDELLSAGTRLRVPVVARTTPP
jgi:hypothetical protein